MTRPELSVVLAPKVDQSFQKSISLTQSCNAKACKSLLVVLPYKNFVPLDRGSAFFSCFHILFASCIQRCIQLKKNKNVFTAESIPGLLGVVNWAQHCLFPASVSQVLGCQYVPLCPVYIIYIVLWIEARALCMASKCSTNRALSPGHGSLPFTSVYFSLVECSSESEESPSQYDGDGKLSTFGNSRSLRE